MKKILMAICCFLTLGFILAGCNSANLLKNSEGGLIYNGNAGVVVDGYLYYGNAFSDVSSFTQLSELKSAKGTSYLARYNLINKRDAKGINFTPNGNEKLVETVVASDYQFMFTLGDYLFYLRPDEHRYGADDGTSSHQFTYPVLCSTRGDKEKEQYTFESEVSKIEVLEYDGNYYIVALAGDKLLSLKVNGGSVSAKTLAENVSSVAIPETTLTGAVSREGWNGKIYYVATDEDEKTGIYEIKVNDENSEKSLYNKNNGTIQFLQRQSDIIVYSYQNEFSQTQIFYNDVSINSSRDEVILIDDAHRLPSTSASDINIIFGNIDTVIFEGSNGMKYKNARGNGSFVVVDEAGTEISDFEIMFIDDKLGYLVTSTNIYEVDFSPLTHSDASGKITLTATNSLETAMTAIHTTGELYSYDGENIYYYAQLEELSELEQELIDKEKEEAGIEVSEDEDSSTAIVDTDSGYYLYKLNINSFTYELIGKTSFEERHSDYKYEA